MMTRDEHLEDCKKRALMVLDEGQGDEEVWAAFCTTMKQHPETINHPALVLGMRLMMTDTMRDMRKFIEDFI